MRKRIYRMIGAWLLKLTALRNGAWEVALRRKFRSIHSTTLLEYPLQVSDPRCMTIGARTRVSWYGRLLAVTEHLGQTFSPEIVIGDDCYLGNHVHVVATNRVWIGKKVMVADGVFLSDYFSDRSQVDPPDAPAVLSRGGEVHIGDGSWIGENVSIVGNVRIGQHCVVGANAVVTLSLPAYSVAVGVPARVIKRYNFSSARWEATDPGGGFLGASPGGGSGPEPEKASPRRHSPGKPTARSS